MEVRRYKTVQQDIYNSNGVYLGTKSVLVSDERNQNQGTGLFDYEEYEQQSAYGYDHSAYDPDIGDKH